MFHDPPRFGALPLIDPFSFGKRGHPSAHGAISTSFLMHFAEHRADLSKMIAELGGFLSLTRSLAAVYSLLHTV